MQPPLVAAISFSLSQVILSLLFEVNGLARVSTATLPPGKAVDDALVAGLQNHMTQQSAWREMGLTIGQLAQQLAVPQYRLRQMINTGLGYRNFSDFLNSYRIAEAAQRLADPAEQSLPVLTIAMDAGFRSLSSFNKAFKETQGVTPSVWRKQQQK